MSVYSLSPVPCPLSPIHTTPYNTDDHGNDLDIHFFFFFSSHEGALEITWAVYCVSRDLMGFIE